MEKEATITYPVNSDHMGDQYLGGDKDLNCFISVLAEVMGRKDCDFVVERRPSWGDWPEWEPTEAQWNQALDLFWAKNPELWAN